MKKFIEVLILGTFEPWSGVNHIVLKLKKFLQVMHVKPGDSVNQLFKAEKEKTVCHYVDRNEKGNNHVVINPPNRVNPAKPVRMWAVIYEVFGLDMVMESR